MITLLSHYCAFASGSKNGAFGAELGVAGEVGGAGHKK